MDFQWWGNFGLVSLGVSSIAMAAMWLIFTVWWKSATGRIVSAFFLVMALFMGLAIFRILGGVIPNLELVRAILYNALALVFWSCIVAFLKVQFFPDRPWFKRRYTQQNPDKEEPNGKETPRVPDA